MVISLVYLYYC